MSGSTLSWRWVFAYLLGLSALAHCLVLQKRRPWIPDPPSEPERCLHTRGQDLERFPPDNACTTSLPLASREEQICRGTH